MCSDPHVFTGTRDDRLKRLLTGERIDGEQITPLVCGACLASWRRRPYAEDRHSFIGLEEWQALRIAHLTAGKGCGKVT